MSRALPNHVVMVPSDQAKNWMVSFLPDLTFRGPELLILLKPRINSLDGICFFQNGNPHFDDQNQQNGFQNQQSGSQNRQRGTQNQQSGTQNQQSGKARINKSGRATYMQRMLFWNEVQYCPPTPHDECTSKEVWKMWSCCDIRGFLDRSQAGRSRSFDKFNGIHADQQRRGAQWTCGTEPDNESTDKKRKTKMEYLKEDRKVRSATKSKKDVNRSFKDQFLTQKKNIFNLSSGSEE